VGFRNLASDTTELLAEILEKLRRTQRLLAVTGGMVTTVTSELGAHEHALPLHSDDHLDSGPDELLKVTVADFGPVAAGLSVDVVAMWSTPFPDTDYSVQITVEEDSDDGLQVVRLRERFPDLVVARVSNDTAQSRSGLLHAWAIRHPIGS
jgi:hypothetical protein